MKKVFKIGGISIVVILILMIALPYIFKDKIVEMVKTEINNSVNAEVDFQDFSLSLFRSFPDFSFGIEGLTVVGIDRFKEDTLVDIGNIYLKLDLGSVFSGDGYEIKSILIKNPTINTLILKDGLANYDIAKESESSDVEEETPEESSDFMLKLKSFVVENADIIYDDREGDMKAILKGMDLNLSGDFTASTNDIDLNSSIEEFTYNMDGMNYLTKTHIDFDAIIAADMDKWLFTFKDNELKLNDLAAKFEGTVLMPADDIDMDLTFATEKASFKSVLSLVPALYKSDFEDIKSSGSTAVSGVLKGIYNDDSMPAFDIKLMVENGMFQYPDLPSKVEDVQVLVEINSPTSDFDDMKIDVDKFHFNMAGNPMDIKMKLRTPMSDPNIDASFKGKIDLASVEKFYPLDEGMALKGQFVMDLMLKGKQSSLDKGYYRDFKSSGYMKIKGFDYRDNDLKEGVQISDAEMNFNPKNIDLTKFNASYLGNKIKADGKITNYIDYAFGDGVLKGVLNLKSEYLNLDNMLASEPVSETAEANPAEDVPLEAFEVPENIDFTLNTFIGRIKYDKMTIRAIYGKLIMAESRVNMEELNMEMLGGKLNLNGFYSSLDIDSPSVSMVMGIHNFDVKQSYTAFNTIRQLAPIAQFINGSFSALLTYNSKLDNEMNPVMNTLGSKGMIKTSELSIESAPTFAKLAEQLKYDKLKKLSAKPAMISYVIVDGNLEVKPFDIEIDDIPTHVSGTANLDKTLDYRLIMDVPKSKLGAQANAMIKNLSSQAAAAGLNVDNSETIIVNAFITGKANDPEVKIAVDNPAQDVQDQLEQKVTDEIDKAKKQAGEEAEKLKKQAEDEINNAKKQAQDSLNNVIDKQKLELEKKKKELEKKKKEEEEKAKKKLEEEAKKRLKGFF